MASAVFQSLYENILIDKGITGEGTLLDIGAKDGVIASELSGTLGCSAVALDIEFSAQATEQDCQLVRGDGRELPLRDSSVDVVICNMVFEHVPDEELIIEETARVLKRDATFILIFPNRLWPFDGHEYPPGTTWLPRSLGKHLMRPIDRKYDRSNSYYEEAMYPVSPITVRQKLQKTFANVSFRTDELLNVDLDPSQTDQKLLLLFREELKQIFTPGLSSRIAELIFPVSVYVCEQQR